MGCHKCWGWWLGVLNNFLKIFEMFLPMYNSDPIILFGMSNVNYPQPPSHRTFQLGTFVIDSNFDSGNCCNAEKVGPAHVKFKSKFSSTYGSALITLKITIGHGSTSLLRGLPRVPPLPSQSKTCRIKYTSFLWLVKAAQWGLGACVPGWESIRMGSDIIESKHG